MIRPAYFLSSVYPRPGKRQMAFCPLLALPGSESPMKSSESSDMDLNPVVRLRIFSCAVALMLVGAATIALGHHQGGAAAPARSRLDDAPSNTQTITPIPFEEMNGERVYNASGVVPLDDSRFLFCDNNSGDALFELDLAEDGRKKGPVIRRPLQGLAPKAISDLEAMTLAEEKGRRFIIATWTV